MQTVTIICKVEVMKYLLNWILEIKPVFNNNYILLSDYLNRFTVN